MLLVSDLCFYNLWLLIWNSRLWNVSHSVTIRLPVTDVCSKTTFITLKIYVRKYTNSNRKYSFHVFIASKIQEYNKIYMDAGFIIESWYRMYKIRKKQWRCVTINWTSFIQCSLRLHQLWTFVPDYLRFLRHTIKACITSNRGQSRTKCDMHGFKICYLLAKWLRLTVVTGYATVAMHQCFIGFVL